MAEEEGKERKVERCVTMYQEAEDALYILKIQFMKIILMIDTLWLHICP
jgi:hypothetical protein